MRPLRVAEARSRRRSFFVEVMEFEQQAAGLGLERTVISARRPARVCMRTEFLAAVAVRIVADDEIPGHEIHLFPVLVDEGRRRVRAGLEAKVARAESGLVRFVERTSQNLLFD